MASLLLLLFCVLTGHHTLAKDSAVIDLFVETSTSATNTIDESVMRYPSLANYSDLDYFRSRISVLNDGTLLAGAINKLYHISANFNTLDSLTWLATNTGICDRTFKNSSFQCGNHIRIHELQSDNTTIFVCGTNAIQPQCRTSVLSNLSNISATVIPQFGLVPSHPNFKGLTIKNDVFPGGILAVNYLDAAQVDFGISYQSVNTSGGMINNTVQYRSIQGSDNWLRLPAAFVDYYADSYSNDGSLDFYFIFLTENSVEISGTDNPVIYSRVVRICKNDPGSGVIRGSELQYKAEYFNTYVKAYIYCEKPLPSGADSVPGSASFQYSNIQKVSLRRNSTYRVGVEQRGRIVYGLFTGPTYGPPGSAICVYSADMSGIKDRGVFTIFSEEYRNLRPGQTTCTANNVPNDNPFTCDQATHSTSRPMPEYDVLMSPAVDQLTTDPLVELNGIMATSIYTTQAYVVNVTSGLILMDVMLVGTNDGKVLKIVLTYNGTDHIPLISEELSLADGLPIQNMEPQYVDEEFNHLLLSTDSYIYRIPPHRCSRFTTCVDCVTARDPHCFWNQHSDPAQQGCKVLPNMGAYDAQTWYQDIHRGNATQFTSCGGAPANFTVSNNEIDRSSGNITITSDSSSPFVVTLSIEQLSSCGTVSGSLPGPTTITVMGGLATYSFTSLVPYTLYRVTVTGSSVSRTVVFRTTGDVPMTPSISAIYPATDGFVVYPSIGCLRDDILNYMITVTYQFITCPGNTPQMGSMSLPGANGTIFTITGIGSYASVSSVTVTVQNSFGSDMFRHPQFTSAQPLRTIEGVTTALVGPVSAISLSSSSVRASWNPPSSVCGTITGYSVYVNSVKMSNCDSTSPYTITGLQSFTSYTVGVAVCTIAGEVSQQRNANAVMTAAGIPAAVGDITATSRSASSIVFGWNAAQFNGVNGGYIVNYTCQGLGSTQSNTDSVTSTEYTISGITCYEADCYIRVAARNTAGSSGPMSAYISTTTTCPTSLPSSIRATGITMETTSNDTFSIAWTVPTSYCGPIRTFSVTVTAQGSSTALCSATTSQTYMICNGVQFSQSYNIRVTTSISCDGGSVSSDVTAGTYTHPCFIADAPDNVVFTRTSGVVLGWDQVTNCGNVMYNVLWSCGGTEQSQTIGGISYTIDVSSQTSFSYCLGQVQACNEQGCGRLSGVVSVAVPLQTPPAVAIAGAVNGTTAIIMFTIAQPTDLSDLRYTLNRRQRRPSTTDFQPLFDNAPYNFANVLMDFDPQAEETYEYQMVLHNSLGDGLLSNILSLTTTQEAPPGSPMGVTAIQEGDDLVIQWTAPPSSSPDDLRFSVQYDTIPPSDVTPFMVEEIRQSPYTIMMENLIIDRFCSVGVRARDERTGFYGSWSYAGSCSVNATAPPGRPLVDSNSITYTRPLFQLKWDPPSDSNVVISEYTISLRNSTAAEDECSGICNDAGSYEYRVTVKPDSTAFQVVYNVTMDTCFCAVVEASNRAGTSGPSDIASFWYKYDFVPPTTDSNRAISNDDSTPIVAIILGVVLVVVVLVTLVLAVVFFKLYSVRMQQARASESSKALNSNS